MLPEADDLEIYFHEMFRIFPEYQRKRQEWKKAPVAAAAAAPPLLALPPAGAAQVKGAGKAAKRSRGRHQHRHNHQRHLLDLLQHSDTADLLMQPPELELPVGNASHFCTYATVRQLVLERWTRLANRAHLRSSYGTLPSTVVGGIAGAEQLTPRAPATVWPDGAVSGHSDIDSDEDTEQMEELLMAGLVQSGPEDVEESVTVSKIVSFGLTTVFQLVRESRQTQPALCARALRALLDVLQGQMPEGLRAEPAAVIDPLFDLLLDLSTSGGPSGAVPTPCLTMQYSGIYGLDGSGTSTSGSSVIHAQIMAFASACLLALVVVRGDTGKTITAIAGMLMCGRSLAAQDIYMPLVLATLQRSIHYLLLTPDGETPGQLRANGRRRPDWITHGIPRSALVARFPVSGLPMEMLNGGTCHDDSLRGSANHGSSGGGLQLKSLASDGRYLYLFTNRGLVKVGSGYGGTERGHVYACKPDFYPNDKGTLLYCAGNLYLKLAGRRGVEFLIVQKETLLICGAVPLHNRDVTATVVFSDGDHLATISPAKDDGFIVRTLNHHTAPAAVVAELPLQLARRCVDILGAAAYEDDAVTQQSSPTKQQSLLVNSNSSGGVLAAVGSEDEVATIAAGKEFGLIRSCSGTVLYNGRAAALGIKQACARASGKWAELILTKAPKVTQIAVGHDGLHAVLLTEDGSVFFVGTARRGEDGDASNKARRQPKPTKPKKMIKVDGQFILSAACNNGTTALVSRDGVVYMFGKDTAHADPCTGIVHALRGECIVQVALGKAHALALTSKGAVYTFGINNKYQCGRDFVHSVTPPAHSAQKLEINASKRDNQQQNHFGSNRSESSAIVAMDTCCSDPTAAYHQPARPRLPHSALDHRRHIAVDVDSATTSTTMSDEYATYSSGGDMDEPCPPAGNPDRLHEVALSREHMCAADAHVWHHDLCMVCTVCRECTGYGIGCLSMRPGRNPGQDCGCGEGDSGCSECGCCRVCARDQQPGQQPQPSAADASAAAAAAALDISTANGMSASAVGLHRLDMIFRDKVKDLAVQQHQQQQRTNSGHRTSKLQEQLQSRLDIDRKSRSSSRKSISTTTSKHTHQTQGGKVKSGGSGGKAAVATNTYTTTTVGATAPMSPVHRPAANLAMRQSNILAKEGGVSGSSDIERDTTRVACLPPAKLQLPVDSPVVQIACGLHHSLLLLQNGQVYSFGSNQYGQLGCGDILAKASVQLVKLPCSATYIAAGSNHSAALTAKGEVYTFGNWQKGQLGRTPTTPPTIITKSTGAPGANNQPYGVQQQLNPRYPWYAAPAPVAGVGAARHGRRATWVGASADQTFVSIDESLINGASLARSTVMANSGCIVLIPNQPQPSDQAPVANQQQSFHCLVINKRDGNCTAHHTANEGDGIYDPQAPVGVVQQQAMRTVGEQADLRVLGKEHGNMVAVCMDPVYNVVCAWRVEGLGGPRAGTGGYRHVVEVYNIIAASLPVPFLPLTNNADIKPQHHKGSVGRSAKDKELQKQGKLFAVSQQHKLIETTAEAAADFRHVSFASANYYSLLMPELSMPTITMTGGFGTARDHVSSDATQPVLVSRSQAAIHLLVCLDTLSAAHDRQQQHLRQRNVACLLANGGGSTTTVVPSSAAAASGGGGKVAPLDVDGGGKADPEAAAADGKAGSGAPSWRYSREDFQAVNRFESHGGGWGYSGHSVEAIRFMVDTDVLLGGFGLFGGRGEYTGKMKLLDIGPEGGEQEGDGDLLAETEELPFECGPRQKYPMLFDEPVPLQAHRWYVAWCRISGPSSDCGSSGQTMVTTEDQILFYFKSSKKSNNGTDVNAGQIPQLLYKVITPENQTPTRPADAFEPPTHILSKDFSRSVSVECFQSLLALLKWSWATLKVNLADASAAAHSHVTLEMDRLVFISRACLHLLRMYINEIYPSQIGTRRVPAESAQLAECVGDVRTLLNAILSEGVAVQYLNAQMDVPKGKQQQKKLEYHQGLAYGGESNGGTAIRVDTKAAERRFSAVLDMVLDQCHVTFVKCFHAFYPTANLKWTCLCQLLVTMDTQRTTYTNHQQPPVARLLSAVLAALCAPAVRLRTTFPLLSSSTNTITNNTDTVITPPSTITKATRAGDSCSNCDARSLTLTVGEAVPSISGVSINKAFSCQQQHQQPSCSSRADLDAAGNGGGTLNGSWYYPLLVDQMNYRAQIDDSNAGNSIAVLSPFRCSWKEVLDQLLCLISEPVTRALHAAGQKTEATALPLPSLAKHCCHLLARVLGELVHQCNASEEELQLGGGRLLHSTPSRFTRTNQSRTWNTGNGSPDAVAFHVDRPGIAIVGCSIYAGLGHYEFELELLEDQSNMGSVENHGHTQRWNTLEITKGSFGPEDFAPDVTEIKFDRAVPIKEGVKYALRLRNHGGRTNNGDGGLNSVRGSDGTTFIFTTCSLSFNGTSLTRGQIPIILYYSNPSSSSSDHHRRRFSATTPTLRAATANNNPQQNFCGSSTPEQQARRCALNLIGASAHTTCHLLVAARVQLSQLSEQSVVALVGALADSHMVRTLLPLVLAMVGGLAANDPRSAVEILNYIHEMLPHVAALNLLAGQSTAATTCTNGAASTLNSIPEHNWDEGAITTTSQHYAWVQSDHPYKPATVSHYRVRFPSSVKWLSIEFDPLCSMSQPEDILQLYVPSSCGRTNMNDWSLTAANELLQVQQQQPYWPAVHKFTSCMQWPTNAILLPGREVIFSLETASDYLKDDRASSYGFRCLVVGYEWPPGCSSVGDGSSIPATVQGLRQLESELAYLGGMCAASLIKKDLALPLNRADESEPDVELAESVAANTLQQHGPLLAKGLVLSAAPTVTQALDATLPYG